MFLSLNRVGPSSILLFNGLSEDERTVMYFTAALRNVFNGTLSNSVSNTLREELERKGDRVVLDELDKAIVLTVRSERKGEGRRSGPYPPEPSRSMLTVPVSIGSGRVFGVLEVIFLFFLCCIVSVVRS